MLSQIAAGFRLQQGHQVTDLDEELIFSPLLGRKRAGVALGVGEQWASDASAFASRYRPLEIPPPLLERQIQDCVVPLTKVARFGNQFQVTHVVADRSSFGMAVGEPGKLAPFALPSLRHGSKANVLSEDRH